MYTATLHQHRPGGGVARRCAAEPGIAGAPTIVTRRATLGELVAVEPLLDQAGLPNVGVGEALEHFCLGLEKDAVVGCIGLERRARPPKRWGVPGLRRCPKVV